MNQPGHIHFKQAQITSQYNVFEITFKTIDASGMLLYALSVEKGDYLTIELVRGKIRLVLLHLLSASRLTALAQFITF